MKIFIYLVLIAISSLTFAEGTESSVNNINAKYVEEGNFIQNPYGKLVSGGGVILPFLEQFKSIDYLRLK